MKKIAAALLGCFLIALSLPAQNQNVTFRSKLTFPGQTLANVWGYTAGGHEYVLAGGAKGLIIVDITNPEQPQQIVQIPGPNNLWKEIKTYGHYAYVVSEGGQGIQIVDLSGLPAPNLNSRFYTGDGAIAGQLGKIHALHIDTAKGFLYAYGGPLFSGGAKVFNLNPDPYNPVYAGKFDQLGYIHDGYVDNDTLYAGHIYQGLFSVVDMRDKSNPKLLATQNTPNNFTHNTWLTDDRRYLLTTDEVNNSTLAAYDISDLEDIRLLDRIQSNPGSNSMVHNTHILGHYAITSWYKDGFTIVDITRPHNLVQVGDYDVFPGESGGGSDGCWGVYPYFPSGTIAATVIPRIGGSGELWILTPNYVRACYLEGKITNGLSGKPLNGVQVEITGTLSPAGNSLPDGAYKMGQAQEGYFTIRISKTGFQSQEFTVLLRRGEVCRLDAALYPSGNLNVSGQVTNAADGKPASGAAVSFSNFGGVWETGADASGQYQISLPPGVYDVAAGADGFGQALRRNYKITKDLSLNFSLSPEYKTIRGEGPGAKTGLWTWPNPFKMAVEIIPGDVEGAHLIVTDQFGRFVEEMDLPAQPTPLRLGTEWPAGIYYLKIETPGQIPQTAKLIKMP